MEENKNGAEQDPTPVPAKEPEKVTRKPARKKTSFRVRVPPSCRWRIVQSAGREWTNEWSTVKADDPILDELKRHPDLEVK